ncbi:hypothetical protein H4R26_003908 [Coemansia thaxteri]|uniref:Importin N-terminal domain-containing protein n=1 Tax=Coemansia thaxteri TaxID=2663907 RepID=A0A9W8BI47_9FUNG|nr:hypothetical protein H4R26_003908 [Coemansia thaxteri]
MEHHVFEALQGCLSAEPNMRMRSELALKQLELNTEFSLAVASIALASAAGPAVQQAAIVQLRGYIGRHWSIGSAKYEQGPIPDQQIKCQVREKVFALLSSDDRKLRTAAAAAIAGLARYDWPDEWPQLFSQLVELLHGRNRGQVHAAMCVFGEWVNSDLSGQHMEQIGALLPQLKRIFVSSDEYGVETRVMSVKVFGDCIEIIANMSSVQKHFVDTHAPPILEEWMHPIVDIISQPVSTVGNVSNIPLKIECIRAVVRATEGLPRLMSAHNVLLLEALWQQLQDIQEPFLHAFVYDDSEHNESATSLLVFCDDDGSVYSIDNYLLGIFEWISKVAESKSVRKFFITKVEGSSTASPTPLFGQLVTCLLSYAQITSEMMDDWADDMDLFVADEDEEGYRFNVRVSVQELLQILDMAFESTLPSALSWATHERTKLALQWRLQEDSRWWLVSEAILWAIGTLADSVISQKDSRVVAGQLDLDALFESNVWPLAQSPAFPYGQGRAFIFASSIGRALPADIAAAFIGASSKAVADTQLHSAVRLSAVRATGNFCRQLTPELAKPHQDTFVRGLATVIPQLSEDSAHVALDAMHAALRVDKGITATLEPVISQVAIGIWQRYPGDVLLTSIVIDIVEDMASNEQACEAFAQRALPIIGSTISQSSDGVVISSGIDILAGLIKGGPTPMPEGYTDGIFPQLMQILLASTDSEVLQSGQACLKFFVQKDAQRVVQWRDSAGVSGLDHIIRFVALLLSPDSSESSALFVGDLATKIVQKCGSLISGDVLAELVRVVTARLATARTSSFCSSLLPFYAHLVAQHPLAVVDLLDRMRFVEQSGLPVVLAAWFKHYLDVQGYYNRKVSAVALTRLFALRDPRISAIIVPGDIVPNTANKGKIVTRSMSRSNPDQYTQISAPAKIIKLLLAEIEVDVESMFARQTAAGIGAAMGDAGASNVGEDGDDDDAEEDDWEDDAEYDALDDLASAKKYGYLSDFIDGENNDDDDDDDDEDVLADPIYNQDLNQHLGVFFGQAINGDRDGFNSAIVPALTAKETMVLERLCAH